MTTDNTTNQRPVATQAEWGEIVARAASMIATTPKGEDMPDEYAAASMAIFTTPAPDMGAVLERLGLFITQAWPDNPTVEDAIQRSREHDGPNSLAEDEEVIFTTYEDLKRLAFPTVGPELAALIAAHTEAHAAEGASALAYDEDDTPASAAANSAAMDVSKAAYRAVCDYQPRNLAELAAKVELMDGSTWGDTDLLSIIASNLRTMGA